MTMFTFTDYNGLQVELFFNHQAYKIDPKHVLVIVRHNERYLCTIHKKRGIEFPGGKVENDESLQQAAIREVMEETGIQIKNLKEIGYYIVHDQPKFSKAIFLAEYSQHVHDDFILETSGKVWMTETEVFSSPHLSFYMKDEGMKRIMQEVKLHDEWNNI